MDVNFIASVAAVADDHIPIPASPPRGATSNAHNNNTNGNSNAAAAAPLFLVPPTPLPPATGSLLSRYAARNSVHSHSAPAGDNNNNSGIGSRMFPPTVIVNDTPPPTRRSIHNLYNAPIPLSMPLMTALNDNHNINRNGNGTGSGNMNNINSNLDININNNRIPLDISFPFHFHSSSGHEDVVQHATLNTRTEDSFVRIPVTNTNTPVPTLNVGQRDSSRSVTPQAPQIPGITHAEQQQRFSFLEPNSAPPHPSTQAQAAHIPLFLESNLNANVPPTPNITTNPHTHPDPIIIDGRPTNNAILPPINLNVNNQGRYTPSTSAPTAPHLPFSTIPSIPSIPPPSRSEPANINIGGENVQNQNNRKRKRVDSSAVPTGVSVAKKEADIKVDADTEDDNCCSICLEPWNRSGPHQLCCLPCGHLFGRSCIEQWLRKKKTPSVCPNCKYNMKGKKATLIFGAPHRLVTVDQGQIEEVKIKLEKEKETHEKTKKRLKEKEEQVRHLRSRLRQLNSLQVLGGGTGIGGGRMGAQGNDPPQHAGHIPQQSHYTRIAHSHTARASGQRRTALMNAVRSVQERSIIEDSSAPGSDRNGFELPASMTVRTNRPSGLLNVAARLPSITGPPGNRMTVRVVPIGNTNNVGGTGNPANLSSRMEVQLMCELRTNGGSKALAFDDSGNVIFNERKPIPRRHQVIMGYSITNNDPNIHMGHMSVQKICRRPIVASGSGNNGGVISRSRVQIMGRINDICSNTNIGSAYRGYIAVCVQSKKVLILNRALDEVVSYATSAIPLCSWWVGRGEDETETANANGNSNNNNSHILLVGLTDGHILAFDVRNTSLGPMAQRKINTNRNGPIAVHSIAQVGTSGIILAATPTGIHKVTFSEFASSVVLTPIHTIPSGELCSSMAIHRNHILVSTRGDNNYGTHTIYNGLADDNNMFGSVLQSNLTGHKLSGLYEHAAILSDSTNDSSPLVFAPDVGESARYTRYWQRDPNSTAWSSAQIAPYPFSGTASIGQTAVVKTLALPNWQSSSASSAGARLRIGNAPMAGMAAHLGDSTLQIFSIVRR